MKRSLQEYVELGIFGLIAAFVATALIYFAGWGVTFVGWLLRKVAFLLWFILKFILPFAIVVVAAYVIWRVLQNRRNSAPQGAAAAVVTGSSTGTATEATSEASEAKEATSATESASNGEEEKK